MNRITVAGLRVVMAAGITLSLAACSSGGSTPAASAFNLAGTWTVKTVSTQGHGTKSGTATVTQTGQGVGVTGSTTLSAPVGGITVSQTGTALTGTITNSLKATTYNFTGTLSSGSLTLTGTAVCTKTATQTLSLTGTLSSTSAQGTYTIPSVAGCFSSNDGGTFTATKQ
jgi:hypothetical protein